MDDKENLPYLVSTRFRMEEEKERVKVQNSNNKKHLKNYTVLTAYAF